MHAIADTDKLVADGVISPDQARIIEERGREAMIALAVNFVLLTGIVAATGGLIFWLANAIVVASLGLAMLVTGGWVLARGNVLYRMFGTAATLIGAGLLIGGSAYELLEYHADIAGQVMAPTGLVMVAVLTWMLAPRPGARQRERAIAASILLMGLAFHLFGFGIWLSDLQVAGWPKVTFYLYAAALLAAVGAITDLRPVTALAIVALAQVLETGPDFLDQAYFIVSPEPTLTIAEMLVVLIAAIWVARRPVKRLARHAGVLAMAAFLVANMAALVGSFAGDIVGTTLWGPKRFPDEVIASGESWDQAMTTFRAQTLDIAPEVYAWAWGVVLAGLLFWSLARRQRGLFNVTLAFATVHAYSQFLGRFSDQSLAWVIGGLAAIPIAWSMWRINLHLTATVATSRGQ